MNIMFISDKLSGGGAERVTAVLASYFAKKHNVYLVTHRNDNPYSLAAAVKVICLNIDKGTNAINRLIHLISSVISIRNLKKQYKIDCTISMLSGPNVRNVLSRRGDRVITSVRCNCSEVLNRHSLEWQLNSFACRKSDYVVALSKGVERDEVENFGSPQEKTLTIYNPCNLEFIKQQISVSVDDQEFDRIRDTYKTIYISAGRLVIQKGQWHLIKAFSKIVQKHSDCALLILGEGELRPELEELIKEYGLCDRVFLLGFVNNPYYYMAKCDIFVFTSLFEGFGNILLEAMACSLPVISTNCPSGPGELLREDCSCAHDVADIEYAKYGILIKAFEEDIHLKKSSLTQQELSLYHAMERLKEDEEMRLHYVSQSKRRILGFSTEAIAKQWESLF